MTKEKEQWLRYRREIGKLLTHFKDFELTRKGVNVGVVEDYFSYNTIKEIESRDPFESLDAYENNK